MTSYTTSDLSRRSGDIIAEAMRHPVTITQRNKPRLVLLSIDDYRLLVERAESRVVATIEAMPDDLLADVRAAMDACAREPGEA